MTIRKIVILWSEAPARVVEFYRLVGLPLRDESRGDARKVHQTCVFDGIHFAVKNALPDRNRPARSETANIKVGFSVPDIAQVTERLRAAGELRELVPVQRLAWGMRAVLEDPDGRAVELSQNA